MPEPAGKKRHYTLLGEKHISTKTDAELAEIRERYKAGVPQEIIEHIAGTLADAIIEEGKCGEVLGDN